LLQSALEAFNSIKQAAVAEKTQQLCANATAKATMKNLQNGITTLPETIDNFYITLFYNTHSIQQTDLRNKFQRICVQGKPCYANPLCGF
jgi:hypothetical protein